MTPRRVTSCAVPDTTGVQQAAWTMRDVVCERVVLSGLLEDPRGVALALREVGLEKADLTEDLHNRAYDLFLYCGAGSNGEPILAAVSREMQRRRDYLDFPHWRQAHLWLADVWGMDTWFKDIAEWADGPQPSVPHPVWTATAAAKKVVSLANRRRALFAGLELIRDAFTSAGVAGDGSRADQHWE